MTLTRRSPSRRDRLSRGRKLRTASPRKRFLDMSEVRQLRDPLRTPESEYTIFVQRMLDLAVAQPARSSQIVRALTEAEKRRLRLVEPWLFSDDCESG